MTRYVALYCRISKDANGRTEGVKAQERWGRAYAARQWPTLPVRVFADNHLSAADDTHRPEFERFRRAVAAGEVAHVWAVEQSRLERREVGWFELAAELDAAGVAELHAGRDGIISVRSDVAGIKAVISAGEVRKLKRRVNDKLAEVAAAGRPSGARVFGYRHGLDAEGGKTLHIVEAEAEVIREAAERVLGGWSLTSIADDLTRRGLHGPHRRKVRDESGEIVDTRPSTITSTSVRSWLTNPTVAGQRVHTRTGLVRRGVWDAILADDVAAAVRDKLAAPRVVHRSDGGTYPLNGLARNTGRRYLLTGGTALCGVCGHVLVASLKQLKNGEPKPYYLCHTKTGGRACVGILGDALESHVVGRLLDELDKPAFRDALAADEHAASREAITAALRALDAQRNDLAGMWAARDLTGEEWQRARHDLGNIEARLRTQLAAVPPPPATNIDPATLREAWSEMTLDERREVISMFVGSVTVRRATPGVARFDPSRVAVEWRHA
jgi:DNA invertase Pin-like site-specific DNA recombinase